MTTVGDIASFLERLAPPHLAEVWDNVGLLVGDRQQQVQRAMTCLTITPESAQEAIEQRANLIVTHHPLPFREFRRLTSDTHEGRILLQLIGGGVAIYSPHTAFDSAARGINQQLAEGLGLKQIVPIRPVEPSTSLTDASSEHDIIAPLGSGRFGRLPHALPVSELVQRLKTFLGISQLQGVGSLERTISSVAVACGSAGEFLRPARQLGCEALVLGETNFHTCLEAQAAGMVLLLTGHYASERFAVEQLVTVLEEEFGGVTFWPSREEADPLAWV